MIEAEFVEVFAAVPVAVPADEHVVREVDEVQLHADGFGDADVEDAADVAVDDPEGRICVSAGAGVGAAALVGADAQHPLQLGSIVPLRRERRAQRRHVVVARRKEEVVLGQRTIDRPEDASDADEFVGGIGVFRGARETLADVVDEVVDDLVLLGRHGRLVVIEIEDTVGERVVPARSRVGPFGSQRHFGFEHVKPHM
jgi:hypothetical protein